MRNVSDGVAANVCFGSKADTGHFRFPNWISPASLAGWRRFTLASRLNRGRARLTSRKNATHLVNLVKLSGPAFA